MIFNDCKKNLLMLQDEKFWSNCEWVSCMVVNNGCKMSVCHLVAALEVLDVRTPIGI